MTLNHYLYKGDADPLPETRAMAIHQTVIALGSAEKVFVCVIEPGIRAALEQRAGTGPKDEFLDSAKIAFPMDLQGGRVQSALLWAMKEYAKPNMLTTKAQMSNRREREWPFLYCELMSWPYSAARGKEAFEPQEEVTAEGRNLEFHLTDNLGKYLLTVGIDTNIVVQGTKDRQQPERNLPVGDRCKWFKSIVIPALVAELENVAKLTGEKVGVLFGATQRLETLKAWERDVMEELEMTLDHPDLDIALD